MIESKPWEWSKLNEEGQKKWKEPSIESYYLINRWKKQNKKDFLDIGCGLGRHTIQFAKKGFNVNSIDLSEEEIKTTKDDEIVIYVDYNLSNKSIKFKKESDKKKLITLCTKLKEENILMQIKNIDFKNKSVINLKGETGLVVCLKKDNKIEKNVIKLRNVLIDLKNRKEVYGKVDLTYNDYILYSPYSN